MPKIFKHLFFLSPKLEHVYTQHISGVSQCIAVEQEETACLAFKSIWFKSFTNTSYFRSFSVVSPASARKLHDSPTKYPTESVTIHNLKQTQHFFFDSIQTHTVLLHNPPNITTRSLTWCCKVKMRVLLRCLVLGCKILFNYAETDTSH